jgi:histone-lysine N-methyltransferase SETMAR
VGFQYLDHPLYSPDLAPSGYHLFPGLKKHLKDRHFSSDAEVIAAVQTSLDGQFSLFFLGPSKGYSNGLRNVLSFVGYMLNKSRVWSLQCVSFLVGLKTYQHPIVHHPQAICV